MAAFLLVLFALLCIVPVQNGVLALNNGLALTPPMGWLSWVAFGCQTDCAKHPTTCISEDLMTAMADRVVADGYQDAGYQFVNVDDCWLAPERDANGNLQPDPDRFSHGIAWLADYMHQRNLKFGIYEDYGTKTCAGFPGSMDHATQDSNTFASWGVDYLKLDGCNANTTELDEGYPAFSQALNATGRPIVYSSEWPLYNKKIDLNTVRANCNLWRNSGDIGKSWTSIDKTMNYFNENQDKFGQVGGPGGWNDPDMLVIGNNGVTVDQAKVQMAVWSIWSAPLIMSVDLRTIDDQFKQILLNKKVIAVDQDPLGIMGSVVATAGDNVNVYTKPMTPVDPATGDYSYAIAFVNRDLEQPVKVIAKLEQLGLTHENGYVLEDLFEDVPPVTLKPDDRFTTPVNATGVTMYKATVVA